MISTHLLSYLDNLRWREMCGGNIPKCRQIPPYLVRRLLSTQIQYLLCLCLIVTSLTNSFTSGYRVDRVLSPGATSIISLLLNDCGYRQVEMEGKSFICQFLTKSMVFLSILTNDTLSDYRIFSL